MGGILDPCSKKIWALDLIRDELIHSFETDGINPHIMSKQTSHGRTGFAAH
jgi:hypothetical protein